MSNLEDIKQKARQIIGNASLKVFNNEKYILETLNEIVDEEENDLELVEKKLKCIENYLSIKEKMITIENDYEYLCNLSEKLNNQTVRRTDGIVYNPIFKVTNSEGIEKYFLTRASAEQYIKLNEGFTINKIIEVEENDNNDLTIILEIIKRNYKRK